ncbi:hypothetical protein Elgi_03650 [Paenibacillus elgii]|uniref:class I adenylate-forming enzyme family protein n=1 Tax=Paenibacillus elgii TaxID=189691 RepID=UPI002D7C6F1D|nr:hypothetical protein Elgi_03650 [Paenibacillus elgii]
MGELLRLLGQTAPLDKIALAEGNETVTYGQLAERIRIVRSRLPVGGKELEPVGLVTNQSVDSVIVLLSCLDGGVAVLPVDDLQTTSDLARIGTAGRVAYWIVPEDRAQAGVNTAETAPMVPYSRLLAPGKTTADELDGKQKPGGQEAGDESGGPGRKEEPGEAPVSLYLLSSGSTGLPKLACLPMQTLLREGRKYRDWFGYRPDDLLVATVPLHHLYGLTGALFGSLTAGATLHICRHPTPRKAANLLRACQGTVLLGVPSFYHLLCMSRHIGQGHAGRLRFAISAGGALAPDTAAAFEGKFGKRVLQLYGSTETGAVAAEHPHRRHRKGSCGYLLPGVEVRMEADGRLAVRSASLFGGYVAGSGKECPVQEGWFVTDDLAAIEEQELTVIGRVPRHINVAGRKVNPKEIEDVLKHMPRIREAKVAGRPDELQGEIIVAWLTADDGVSVKAVRDYLKTQLAAYKIPHEIHLDGALPSWKERYVSEDEQEGAGQE